MEQPRERFPAINIYGEHDLLVDVAHPSGRRFDLRESNSLEVDANSFFWFGTAISVVRNSVFSLSTAYVGCAAMLERKV
jgi:hypothetical protein